MPFSLTMTGAVGLFRRPDKQWLSVYVGSVDVDDSESDDRSIGIQTLDALNQCCTFPITTARRSTSTSS